MTKSKPAARTSARTGILFTNRIRASTSRRLPHVESRERPHRQANPQGELVNRIRTLSIASMALVAIALAGCTPTGDPAGPGEPEPTVTVTVTPEPEAPRADYGFTVFEEATMGSTWEQMSAQLHYPVAGIDQPWNDSVCPWYGPIWNTELATTYAFMDSTNMAAGTRFFYTYDLVGTAGASFP